MVYFRQKKNMAKSVKFVQDHLQYSVGVQVLECVSRKLKYVKHVHV